MGKVGEEQEEGELGRQRQKIEFIDFNVSIKGVQPQGQNKKVMKQALRRFKRLKDTVAIPQIGVNQRSEMQFDNTMADESRR